MTSSDLAGLRVEANGVETYFEVDGPTGGEAVVLLHSGFVTIESWAPQRSALAARYRLYPCASDRRDSWTGGARELAGA